jgi:hypothetical protein
MKQKSIFFDKKFDISQSYIRLLLIIFVVAVLAKGAAIFRGFSVDDYAFMSGISSIGLGVFFPMVVTSWR